MITQCKPSKQHRVKQSFEKLSFSSAVVAKIARIKFPNDSRLIAGRDRTLLAQSSCLDSLSVKRPFCTAKALWGKSLAAIEAPLVTFIIKLQDETV